MGSISASGRFPGEGNDNPCQYFCLRNVMDRGDWLATVHEVAKNWTWLSRQACMSTISEKKKTRRKKLSHCIIWDPYMREHCHLVLVSKKEPLKFCSYQISTPVSLCKQMEIILFPKWGIYARMVITVLWLRWHLKGKVLVVWLCLTLLGHEQKDFPGKTTGVGCRFLLQGIFPTQGSFCLKSLLR